jgi:hypothetical protein
MSDTAVRSKSARVVFIDDSNRDLFRIMINRGADDGIKVGDQFLVYGLGPEISDPDTGANLGRVEIVRGRGAVTHLQSRMASLTSIERRQRTRRTVPVPGDNSILSMVSQVAPREVVEEDLPFLGVQIGDMAKPL